tara:strand:- start:4774 stop:5640 length:867 start_codon:yes stop_codon:yes gene_type:complete
MKFIKYFFQFIIILFLFFIFKILGYQKASNLGSKIGKKFGKFFRSDKIISKNISFINEYSNNKIEDSKKIIDEVFSNYGRILSEYIFLKNFKNGKLKKHVKVYGGEILDEIKRKNKRVVFISGHFSNFELMAMFIDSSGINLSAIYRPLNNIFLNNIMENIRSQFICKNQIKKGKSGTREMLKFLKKNFSVALMIDQRVSEGIKCNFFGKPAFTTTIPAQIVKKFGCEIVPIYIERVDNVDFKLTINEPITFEKKETIEEITLKLNKILEKMILKNPSQWILTHNRWK